MASQASTSPTHDRRAEPAFLSLRSPDEERLWKMALKAVEADWACEDRKRGLILTDWQTRKAATTIHVKTKEEAAQRQYERWIAQGALDG
ncbi:unnamed protein product, partial [Ectocarpus fasciculatus]